MTGVDTHNYTWTRQTSAEEKTGALLTATTRAQARCETTVQCKKYRTINTINATQLTADWSINQPID